MAKFVIYKQTMVSGGKSEYKNIKVNGCYWFNANSIDKAIQILHDCMEQKIGYVLKIESDTGYKPIYKAIKNGDRIKVLINSIA